MTQSQIIKELNSMRSALGPILSEKYNTVLKEAEAIIKGSDVEERIPKVQKKKSSFNQLVSKYYFK